METYETLYKKKENGTIYMWSIKFIIVDEVPSLCVTHGQMNGKLVEHIKEIVPKAKRNHLEQFHIIASRKWNDKITKEGYSSLSDIKSSKSQTDSTILIRPMLAQTFDKSKYIGNKKCKKINFPCWGQPKFDGIRCLMYIKDDKIIMESRKGTQFYNFENLKNEFSNTLKNEENCIFDGELYSEDMSFEKLSGLVRLKKPKEEQKKDINVIQYYIYDIIVKDNLNATYSERKIQLENVSQKYDAYFNLIKFCPSSEIKTINEVDNLHNEYVCNGYEGLILRNKNGKYEINKRSYDLQKFKLFVDEEFTIIDYCEGTGDEKGLIIFKCITNNGKEFSVRPKGTREYRNELFIKGDTLIGKKLTVIFQEYSSEGIPRFPVGKSIRVDI